MLQFWLIIFSYYFFFCDFNIVLLLNVTRNVLLPCGYCCAVSSLHSMRNDSQIPDSRFVSRVERTLQMSTFGFLFHIQFFFFGSVQLILFRCVIRTRICFRRSCTRLKPICTWMAFCSTRARSLSLPPWYRVVGNVCVCVRVNCDTNRNIDVLLLLLWYVIIARYCYCYYLLFHIGYWHCDTDDTYSFTHDFRSFCCWIRILDCIIHVSDRSVNAIKRIYIFRPVLSWLCVLLQRRTMLSCRWRCGLYFLAMLLICFPKKRIIFCFSCQKWNNFRFSHMPSPKCKYQHNKLNLMRETVCECTTRVRKMALLQLRLQVAYALQCISHSFLSLFLSLFSVVFHLSTYLRLT